jgi:hypothetical protein
MRANAPLMKPTDSVLIQPNAIVADDLRDLMEYVGRAARKDSLVSNFETDPSEDDIEWTVDRKIRNTQEIDLSYDMRQRLDGLIAASVDRHINSFYALTARDWEPVQILHYGPGGHYIPHVDAETLFKDDIGLELWEKTLDRDLSVVFFLNDDFTGGELVFPQLELSIRPQAGTLVCFPSDHNFIHGVNPVASGHRYTLVTWMRVTGMPSVEEINSANMEAYERAWPKQIEQPPRIAKARRRV